MKLRLRRARKQHWADCDHHHLIRPGDYYLEGAEMPGGDLGFADNAGHPVRLRECRACAEQFGRGDRFPDCTPAEYTPTPDTPRRETPDAS